MAKINHITIKDVTRYLETIAYLPELPTATEDSADLVSVNNTLYVKQVTDGVYSYGTIQAGGTSTSDAIDINVNLEDLEVESIPELAYGMMLPLDETTLAELQTNPRRSIHVHGLVDGTEVLQGVYLYSADLNLDSTYYYTYGAADIGFLSWFLAETEGSTGMMIDLMFGTNFREYLMFTQEDDEPVLSIMVPMGNDSSSVEANPTDTPTETLSTIKINDVTYSLPSGGTGETTPPITESVDAPTADSTTYAEHKIYLNDSQLHYIDKEQVEGGTVTYGYEFTSGNSELNTTTIKTVMPQFDDVFTSAESMSKVYSLKYVLEDESAVTGIRLGTGSAIGTITYKLKDTTSPINVRVGKYYSYNASSHTIVSYDTDTQVDINGTVYTFASDSEIKNITVSNHNGTITISTILNSSTNKPYGRIFVYDFNKTQAAYTNYYASTLVNASDVEELVTTLETDTIQPLNQRVTSLESSTKALETETDTNTNSIAAIEAAMGNVQIFEVETLPSPRAGLVNNIYKNNNNLYSCHLVSGEYHNFSFSSISGGDATISSSEYDTLIADHMSDEFNDYFSFDAATKAYASNQYIKLGSSSATGSISFNINTDHKLDRITVEASSWKDSGTNSGIIIEIEDADGNILDETFTISASPKVKTYSISGPSDSDFIPARITIYSTKIYNEAKDIEEGDTRTKINGITLSLNDATFAWKKISHDEVVVDEFTTDDIVSGSASVAIDTARFNEIVNAEFVKLQLTPEQYILLPKISHLYTEGEDGMVQVMAMFNVSAGNDDTQLSIMNLTVSSTSMTLTSSIFTGGTGEGSSVTANPELTGDEEALTSIAINGVNYDIPEGAKAYVEDAKTLVIEEGNLHGIDTSYVDQSIAELKTYIDGKISVIVNDDDTIDVIIN